MYGKVLQGFKRAYRNNQLWKKEMIPLTDEKNKSYEKQNAFYICKKEFNTDKNTFKL